MDSRFINALDLLEEASKHIASFLETSLYSNGAQKVGFFIVPVIDNLATLCKQNNLLEEAEQLVTWLQSREA